MSIYDLLLRIFIETIIIMTKKVKRKNLILTLILLLILIISIVTVSLVTVMIVTKYKYHDMDCKKEPYMSNIPEEKLEQHDWWENSVVYQVYLRSFKDGNGDGIGDLQGLTSMLEHFVDAGIDVIWLAPIFVSPMVDFGYDVSNFYDIHHEYGSMEDFEKLLQKAHELGIRVLIDLVLNHASIHSIYFQLSEARQPGYENFFVWADPRPDPKNGTKRLEPSNWVSEFGGSIWEWSKKRQQFYLHQFAKTMPDFNFRDPAFRREIKNILKFWLEKGADGYRLDALPHVFEADCDENGMYPDEPLTGNTFIRPFETGYTNRMYSKDLIEIYDVLYEWREFIDNWRKERGTDTRLLVAEAYANISRTMLYYGDERNRSGVHFPFNFDFIGKLSKESDARDFVYVISHWLVYMPYGKVANWVLGNHDNNRTATRFGPNMVDGLNALIMILPGVACIYQGDEIGMQNGYVSWEDTIDVRALTQGDRYNYTKYSRDPTRTPFQWDNTTSAGFSSNTSTWLPICDDYKINNLQKQKEKARSHYKVFQALTRLRKDPALSHGNYHVAPLTANTLILVRYLSQTSYTLLFNVGKVNDTVDLSREPRLKEPMSVVICSIHSERIIGANIPRGKLTLQPGEALVLKIQ